MYVTTLLDFLKQVYVLMLMDLPPSGRDLGSHSRVPNDMMMMADVEADTETGLSLRDSNSFA